MQITVSGKQVDTGEALQSHVADQLAGVVEKYFDHALDAKVTFSRNRAFFRCDIAIHACRGLAMHSTGEAASAHAAFDAAAEHIGKRLRRYRRKLSDHTRDMAARARPEAARQVVLNAPGGEEEETAAEAGGANGHAPAIVAELTEEISSLSVGEAVMRLDLSDRTALMFRDRASGALGVVYRRRDGNIGWIDSGSTPAGTPAER